MWVKEVKKSDKAQREYTPIPMWISEEDCYSPNFSLPHNIKILVRALMEIILSVIIIKMIRRHTNSYRSSKE